MIAPTQQPFVRIAEALLGRLEPRLVILWHGRRVECLAWKHPVFIGNDLDGKSKCAKDWMQMLIDEPGHQNLRCEGRVDLVGAAAERLLDLIECPDSGDLGAGDG